MRGMRLRHRRPNSPRARAPRRRRGSTHSSATWPRCESSLRHWSTAPPAARGPVYDYQIDFRTNRARESGANQIAEWTADIGGHHAEIGTPPAQRRGRWNAGDSVQVTLRWATGSLMQPLAVTAPGATVVDDAGVLGAGGTWSLIRLLRAFESDAPDPEGGSSIAISVRTSITSAADASTTARAFLRVRLFHPDTKAELVLPRFPLSLPVLAEGNR